MRSKRLDSVKKYIEENKTVTLDQLCAEFQVSKNTIRRDINELVSSGEIRKIYGGVTIEGFKPMSSFDERNISNLELKQRIARYAAKLVKDGEIIFIDSGTTTMHMVEHLKERQNLTILTNSIEVIMRAIPYPNINVISLSGTLNRKTLSFTGASSAEVLGRFNINKAFLASTGISTAGGATNSSPAETEIKHTALLKSQQSFLLLDHTKFNTIALITYSRFDDIHTLVTDDFPPSDIQKMLEKKGCRILIAEE
ncbi:DeoR/GlpR family DNA-binding transcription regulator [Anaerotalea alkaliphila]|uniref:DeoR/GlpR transcriptional regulator n=1 Tax=Anaerotalea alkaliphila TaxID=2662126 RepID=A0A7X5HY41_9FIRM|nr:DeoR/GlpR family DNA-binding transcription regulator [Anaerotalea alkaliphila]NDL68784.1 DeoR/GlpR transcriptional regulator [Anaerotalea alkaliphila]